ncbi:MAG: ROK family protein [Thermodesulfobacteriota bacterium]|nr:ROK family protein [Thermodesulfobacteriota bacterium]
MEKMIAGKPRTLKKNNRRIVLDLLMDSGEMTIARISQTVHLSKTTIMKITDYLLRNNLIVSAGKGSSTKEGGKRPEIFRFNADAGYVIALHIFPGKIYAVVCDLSINIIERRILPLEPDEPIDNVMDKICNACTALLSTHDNKRFVGIGIGATGIINFKEGIVHFSPHFPSWGMDIPFARMLSERLDTDIPIVIENDCRLQVMAEKARGAACNHANIIAVEAGIGLGCGIILKNRVERGAHYLSGEIGHMIINPLGDNPCPCGGNGCFEVMVSIDRVLQMAKEGRTGFPDSLIFCNDRLEIKNIFDASNHDDPLAMKIIDDIIFWFATGFSNVIMMYDPEIIIIQGIYTKAGPYFIERLREKMNRTSLLKIDKHVELEYSNLGIDRGVIGAATHIIDTYFRSQYLEA